MVRRVGMPPLAARALAVLGLSAALAGCGSTSGRASGEGPEKSCPATVLDTLGRVLARVYHEGVFSERTASARHMIGASLPLRRAVEEANPAAARAAAAELIASGHMTNLRVLRGATTLADLGGPALTPLSGTIADAHGRPIGSYLTSVWSQQGFIAEGNGVGEGTVVLREGERSIAGSLALPAGARGREGSVRVAGVRYQYRSFAGEAYPAGAIRVYLLKPLDSTTALCGARGQDTVVNTLEHVAKLIYAGEAGHRTLTQVRRVQGNSALLQAVAHRDPAATRAAAEALLHQHLVRLRVLDADGRLLVDDGGPFVLAPVSAPLRLHGRTIGSFVLSIQDDEGYKRLTGRLAGLSVLMYMNDPRPRLVKNSLGPAPGNVPAAGSYSYRGRPYRVFTVNAEAFPSGPLTIRVLVPIPYR
jgi:hypothetical protein